MPRSDRPAAGIFGCAGPALSDAEKRLFEAADPLGFILFARNVENPSQLAALVQDLRAAVGRRAPVLIDQEGGRVQRLKPPYWKKRPPMAVFGALAARDLPLARHAARLNARLIAADLAELGIDVDCLPLLDMPAEGAHDVIGDRAFAADPELIADLGRAVMDGLLDGGVMPVVKHIPGHGRALVDSHQELPVVETDLESLMKSDFAPFRALRDAPWAMTAHVVYKAIDPLRPATQSKAVLGRIVRDYIGSESLLLSDDLSMKALKGDFGERTRSSLEAGCDVVLHCNGDMDEMQAIAGALAPMTDAALERLDRADSMLRDRPAPEEGEAVLAGWLAGGGDAP